MKPRGIRNNNPGNIRKSNIKWQGLAAEQTDGAFYQFTRAEYGIRALCRVLRTYQRKYGLNDVRSIINRFAPPVENDTDSYVYAVAKALGVSSNISINLEDRETMIKLLKAIIKHENGQQPYDDKVIIRGIELEEA